MATGLNGRTPAILGAVLVALMLIFGFLNGVPWERRGAAAEVRAEMREELRELRQDVKKILERLPPPDRAR